MSYNSNNPVVGFDSLVGGHDKLVSNLGIDASSIAIQADGKILVAGTSIGDLGNNLDFGLARYNSNGTLDTRFDRDGKLNTDFGINDNDQGSTMAIQADGKILVAGTRASMLTGNDFALARYNSNGTLDTSFDRDGKVTTDFGGLDLVNTMAIQADGKIVVAGSTGNFSVGNDFALARYNSNGTLDTSFDRDGKLTTNFGGADIATSMAIQADGKIVVAGGTGISEFAVARYNSNGSLDTSFDRDGKLTTDFVSNYASATSMAIQADGKIVVAGVSSMSSGNFALVRYNSNGSLDTSFDRDGKLTTDFGGNDMATSMAIQADGKILVAGASSGNFAVARYNSNGSLDTSFDGDGKFTANFGGNGGARSIAIQADGNVLVGGMSNNTNFALVRLNIGTNPQVGPNSLPVAEMLGIDPSPLATSSPTTSNPSLII